VRFFVHEKVNLKLLVAKKNKNKMAAGKKRWKAKWEVTMTTSSDITLDIIQH